MHIRYIVTILLGLLLTGCLSDDGGSNFHYVHVEAIDAFTFDEQMEYAVGDTIFFTQKFSRYLKEDGYSELLDIYETTDDEAFSYYFGLQQFSEFSNAYEDVYVDPEYIVTSGENTADNYPYSNYAVTAILNEAENAYESNVGVILREGGAFRLDLSYVSFNNQSSYYRGEGVSLNIKHRFTNPDNAYLEFEVVEQ
ncbi:hypothetical protein [uncultured Zobellia sp.]|uniref:hypothetical protein n=1 Tax=uncultured Zobellia sp. TaxID=255433 RepID=UPI0025921755|nr:hypothetical protein [uncultured Zobellia sp.]